MAPTSDRRALGGQRTTRPLLWPVVVGVLLLTACGAGSRTSSRPVIGPSGGQTEPAPGGQVRNFTLTAAPTTLTLGPGVSTQGWAFNGTVPGPELRARQGDLVRVAFKNDLPQPSTIHWHGIAVPNGEDGVAGVTQDAVPPGGSASYSFVVATAGTYWYHPHQHSADQEDKGLYGVLIVDPVSPGAPTVDKTLVVDEWAIGTNLAAPPPGDGMDMTAYGIDTVNGHTGAAVVPLNLAAGASARVRVVNAGFLTHNVHVHGTDVRILATDGHEVAGGAAIQAPVPVAAGERVDLGFTVPSGSWSIDWHDGTSAQRQITIPLTSAASGGGSDGSWNADASPIDLSAYAGVAPPPSAAVPTVLPTLHLNDDGMAAMSGGGMSGMAMGGSQFTINGKAFPDTDPIQVHFGDTVELTFVNDGKLVHPMHLHGHAFEPVSVNGRAWAAAMLKDVISVAPGTTVTVRFVADNPGVWMIHCHELHHAAGGMDTLLQYIGAPRLATLSGDTTPE